MTLAGPSPKAKVNMLRPSAWYQFQRGLVSSGGAVSRWSDATANNRNLLQSTGALQPLIQTDGSLLFDGSNDLLQTATFTLIQPTTVYLLFKQVTFTNSDVIADGFTVNSGQFLQDSTTPNISLNAGSTSATNTGFILNTYTVGCGVFSGANSSLKANKANVTTGSVGTTAMAGFTLGADGNGSNAANIQVKEVIIFPVAHTPTQQLQVINYLSVIGGLGL